MSIYYALDIVCHVSNINSLIANVNKISLCVLTKQPAISIDIDLK